MAWQRPDLQTIYERIKAGIESRLTGGTALLRRAVLKILAKVFAGEIHLGYGFGEWLSRQLMVDTSETEWLDRHAYIWGVPRKAGAFASGWVRFHGTAGAVIPAGARLVRPDGVEYAVVSDVTISGGGTVDGAIQATVAEDAGNYPMTGAFQLLSPVDGVDSVEQITDITGGKDSETDDELRARIIQRIQEPPMGGAKHDYERWALEVEGVSGAWCYAPEDAPVVAPGIVRVVFKVSGPDPVPAPPMYVNDGTGKDDGTGTLYVYLAERKPVGAQLQVFPIDKVELSFQLRATPYNSDVAAAVRSNLLALLEGVATPGRPVLISHIRDAIMNAGVDNYVLDYIFKNSSPVSASSDVAMSGFEYPILDAVNVSAL